MKKIGAVLLALLMILTVVAGCGSKKVAPPAATGKPATTASQGAAVQADGSYTDKEHVAAYLHQYGKLPKNYITKKDAEKLGWKSKGSLDKVAPGKSIGGDHFGNYEHQVPDKKGRKWQECDIDYVKGNRGAKRIVYSSDGLIYYSGSHYRDFVKLY